MERRVLGIKIPDFLPREGFSVLRYLRPDSFDRAPETSRRREEGGIATEKTEESRAVPEAKSLPPRH